MGLVRRPLERGTRGFKKKDVEPGNRAQAKRAFESCHARRGELHSNEKDKLCAKTRSN